jgi:hypothetical protein
MIVKGQVSVRGIVPPETALDTDIFIDELSKRSITIHQELTEE